MRGASLRGPRMDAWEAAQELLAESLHEPQIAEFQGPTDLRLRRLPPCLCALGTP